jgi:hypothetical protein
MVTDEKKREWLLKTGNESALELLNNSIQKNLEKTGGLLYKEENKEMNEENQTEVTEKKAVEEEVPTTEQEAVTEEIVAEEVAPVLQKAEDIVDMLEPMIAAMQTLTERMEKLEKAVAQGGKVTAQLLPAASTKSLLKERLQFIGPANTFLVDADPKLVKQKPAENTVESESEIPDTFAGFLNGQ